MGLYLFFNNWKKLEGMFVGIEMIIRNKIVYISVNYMIFFIVCRCYFWCGYAFFLRVFMGEIGRDEEVRF